MVRYICFRKFKASLPHATKHCSRLALFLDLIFGKRLPCTSPAATIGIRNPARLPLKRRVLLRESLSQRRCIQTEIESQRRVGHCLPPACRNLGRLFACCPPAAAPGGYFFHALRGWNAVFAYKFHRIWYNRSTWQARFLWRIVWLNCLIRFRM